MRPMLALAMLGIVAACGRNLDLDENGGADGGARAVEGPADASSDAGDDGPADVDAGDPRAQPGKWACQEIPTPANFRTRDECEADRASKGCRMAVRGPNDQPCNVAEGDAYFCTPCQDTPVDFARFSYVAYLCRCEPTPQ